MNKAILDSLQVCILTSHGMVTPDHKVVKGKLVITYDALDDITLRYLSVNTLDKHELLSVPLDTKLNRGDKFTFSMKLDVKVSVN